MAEPEAWQALKQGAAPSGSSQAGPGGTATLGGAFAALAKGYQV